MVFLHHILQLKDEDPVKAMFDMMGNLPNEKNWRNEVTKLLMKYGISSSMKDIKEMPKNTFKNKVKKVVTSKAFEELKDAKTNRKLMS